MANIVISEEEFRELQARLIALEAEVQDVQMKMEDEAFADVQPIPDQGNWNGEIRVAGKVVTSDYLESVVGTPSGYVRIFADGSTPGYATAIQYAASDWGDDSVIVTVEALYACHGAYNLDRM